MIVTCNKDDLSHNIISNKAKVITEHQLLNEL
jgi:hypothetical protein